MLDNTNFEQMLEDSLKQNNLPEQGTIIETTVLQVTQETVIVDISTKTEASINKKEFSTPPQVGEKIRVYVEAINNSYIKLSYNKVLKQENIQVLKKAYEEKELVSGVIKKATIKGFLVQVMGWEAFLPYSQSTPNRAELKDEEKKEFLDKEFEFSILALEEKGSNLRLLVSLRTQMEKEKNEQKAKYLQSLTVGDIISGKVVHIKERSVLIEVSPGCVGLVRGSDISWDRIKTPADHLKLGDEVNVMVLEIDLTKMQMLLSIKDAKGNIWAQFEEKNPLFSIVEGKVEFVETTYLVLKIQEGIQGLLHISNLSWDKTVSNMKDMYKPGQKLSAMIIKLDTQERKVDFGLKQMESNPWEDFAKKHTVGSSVTGQVTKKSDFALFVEVDKVVGMLHRNDLSWNSNEQNLNHYKIGDEIHATITQIDVSKQRLSLATKDVSQDPWYALGNIQNGDKIQVVVREIVSGGYMVSINNSIEIFMPDSQVSKDVTLKVDDTIDVLVNEFQPRKNLVRISMKALQYQEQKEQLSTYMNSQNNSSEDTSPTLGNVLSDYFDKK